MGDTEISWTDKVWNPIRGCSRVSEGCRHCYAEEQAARIVRMDRARGVPEGNGSYDGLVRLRVLSETVDMGATPEKTVARWTGEVRFIADHLADPLRWKKPRRIFVNSMSDLFHEKLSNEQIAAIFGVMAAAPQHTFQVLTKRARRMREWFEWLFQGEVSPSGKCLHAAQPIVTFGDWWKTVPQKWPLPNVWIGVSVENQEAADERIPELLRTPAAVRFLSCEPLLGPVQLPMVDWVIAGCESGPGARACGTEWLRSLRDQCAATGTTFFLKQAREDMSVSSADKHGRTVMRMGPGSKLKQGGIIELPYLDGVQHAAFPEVSHEG